MIGTLAAIPMPNLAFVVAPAIYLESNMNAVLVVWYLMIAGIIWQFILSLILLNRECGLRNWEDWPVLPPSPSLSASSQ